jgi:soluble lytic murein transglycosylase-like protein
MSSGTAQWRPMIRTAAQELGPPRHLIEAVMQLESSGDKTNVTNTGVAACPQAFGLMQIACGCSAVSCDEFTPILDPQINIRAGACHLKINFDQCGSWDGAICAYFSGHCIPNGIAVDIFGTTDQRYIDVVKAN